MVDLSLIRQEDLWYVVGLIATDGYLNPDGRHITITSKDRDFLATVISALGLHSNLGLKANTLYPDKKIYSYFYISDKKFYDYMLKVGLTPRKSLTIGKLKIPSNYFNDFFRGVIDGDGSIYKWVHCTNGMEQWALKVVSGSKDFLDWLKGVVEDRYRVRGKFYASKYKGKRNFIYQIKFGKLATKVILGNCYYNNCLVLARKMDKANECLGTINGLSKYGNVISS